MTDNKLWYIKQINLFEDISDAEILSIANKMKERKCTKKEILYTPFEDNDSIYVLKRGEVTLYYSKNGKKLIIDVLKPGSVFGNISFEQKRNTHFAEVTENAYICIFTVEDFTKLLQSKPGIMFKFIRFMSDRLLDYEHRLKGGLLDAKEKVLHHLQIIEEKNRKSIFNKLTGMTKRITHEILAHHAGLTRETVTRAINDLKREGKIIVTGDGIMSVPSM